MTHRAHPGRLRDVEAASARGLVLRNQKCVEKSQILRSGAMKLLAEDIPLHAGNSFRFLCWTHSLGEVEVVDAMGRAYPITGAGRHWHYHAHTELTAIVRGAGLRFIGDDIHPFRAPDVVLIGGPPTLLA